MKALNILNPNDNFCFIRMDQFLAFNRILIHRDAGYEEMI